MFILVELKKAIRLLADLVQHQLSGKSSICGFRWVSFRQGSLSTWKEIVRNMALRVDSYVIHKL